MNSRSIEEKAHNCIPSTSIASSIAQSMSTDKSIRRIPSPDLEFAETRKKDPKFNESQNSEKSSSQLLENLPPLPLFKPILKRSLVDIGEILEDPGRNRRPER